MLQTGVCSQIQQRLASVKFAGAPFFTVDGISKNKPADAENPSVMN